MTTKVNNAQELKRKLDIEQRVVGESHFGDRYYYLPLNVLLNRADDVAKREGFIISWDVEDLSDEEYVDIAKVKVSMLIDSVVRCSLITRATDETDELDTESFDPFLKAQNSAISKILRTSFRECRLEPGLEIVDDEVEVAINPAMVELPKVKEKNISSNQESKEITEKVSKNKQKPAKREVKKSASKQTTKSIDNNDSEAKAYEGDPYDFVVNVNNRTFKGMTLREVLKDNMGPAFLQFYAQMLGKTRYESSRDLGEAARDVLLAEGIEVKPKH